MTKYKARITPKGFKQRHGVDYFEVFANTGKYKSLRLMLSIAASVQHGVAPARRAAGLHAGGTGGECVHGDAEGFADGMVCRLLKSLYGLKQSPRNWYLLCVRVHQGAARLHATVSDPCVFWKQSRTGQLHAALPVRRRHAGRLQRGG